MDILRIVLKDFASHALTDIDCTQFKSAIIVGQQDNNPWLSNGVGKTNIFYGIDFALFGKSPYTNLDNTIRDGQIKCEVTLEFKIDNKIYKVLRSRTLKTGTEIKLWEKHGSKWVSIAERTAKATTQILADIIKIDYDTFHNSVLFEQVDLDGTKGLASASATGRINILKHALNIEFYDKLYKIAKDDEKEIVHELNELLQKKESLGDPNKNIEEDECELLKNEDILRETELKKEQLFNDIEDAKARLFQSKNLKALICSKIKLENDLLLLEEKIQKYNIEELDKKMINIQKEIGSFEEYLAEAKSQITSQSNINIVDIQNQVKVLSEQENKILWNRNNLSQEIKRLDSPLPTDDECPVCFTSLTKDYKLEKQRERLCAQHELSEELAKYNVEISKIGSEKQKLEAIRLQAEQDIFSKEALERKINKYSNLIYNYTTDLSHVKDRKKEVLIYLNEDTKEHDSLTKEYNNLLKKVTEYDFSQEEMLQLESKVASSGEKLTQYSRDIDFLNTKKGAYLEKISQEKLKINLFEELVLKIKKIEYKLEISQMVKRAFGPSGIPSMIIQTVLDDLQLEANSLLNDLRPGIEIRFSLVKERSDGELDNTLNIIYFFHGKEKEYKQLSGGQKLLVALCLKMALSKIIQNKLGINIQFLELDEVDQSLDRAGTEMLAEIIKKWHNKFKIFIITHNDWLKGKFSHAIVVNYDMESGSNAELRTTW